MDEYIKTHTIKNMDDIQEMLRNMFGPSLQKMLDAKMEAKLGYAKSISGVEEKIILMYALGMTTSEIKHQIYELFGCNLSDDMIGDINHTRNTRMAKKKIRISIVKVSEVMEV